MPDVPIPITEAIDPAAQGLSTPRRGLPGLWKPPELPCLGNRPARDASPSGDLESCFVKGILHATSFPSYIERRRLLAAGGRRLDQRPGCRRRPEALVASNAGSQAASKAQQTLQEAAQQKQYTFLVFCRRRSGLQAMGQVVKETVAKRPTQATMAYVSVASPADQPLVQRLGVSRSPLPLTIALAPNGAIMGVFAPEGQRVAVG